MRAELQGSASPASLYLTPDAGEKTLCICRNSAMSISPIHSDLTNALKHNGASTVGLLILACTVILCGCRSYDIKCRKVSGLSLDHLAGRHLAMPLSGARAPYWPEWDAEAVAATINVSSQLKAQNLSDAACSAFANSPGDAPRG